MNTPVLLTIKQFCQKHPAFRPGGLRHQIFHEKKNGLAASGSIVRLGRKILIDEEKYFRWVVTGSLDARPDQGVRSAVAKPKKKKEGES